MTSRCIFPHGRSVSAETPARLLAALKPGGLLVMEGFAGTRPTSFDLSAKRLLSDQTSERIVGNPKIECLAEGQYC